MTEMCCKTVYSGSGGYRGHRCGNAARVQRDSLWYCATHDPVKVGQRKAKRQAEWDEKNKAHRELWRLHSAAQAMYDALDRIINELPTRRDWLDPVTEQMAKAALAKARGEAR